MSLKKKELIVSVILLGVLLLLGLNLSVLAADNTGLQGLNIDFSGSNSINNVNTIPNTTPNTPNTVNTNNANNATGQLANTGLENMPWVIIGITVISAMFAYKKVKEYKNI